MCVVCVVLLVLATLRRSFFRSFRWILFTKAFRFQQQRSFRAVKESGGHTVRSRGSDYGGDGWLAVATSNSSR